MTLFWLGRNRVVFKKKLWLKAFFFIGAAVGAGEKILGAGDGQRWTGSATLVRSGKLLTLDAKLR